MVTIYGSPKTSSGRCFWCLEEAGVSYTAKTINFKEKDNKSEEFLKLNPNGKIPALTDGDFTIWESMAINFYIADAYKPELLGSDVKTRGLIRQWSIWSIADLQIPLIDIFIQKFFIPEERRNNSVIEKAMGKLPALCKVLDMGLTGKKYLVEDQFSLADLNVHSVISVCEKIEYDFSDYKNLTNWFDCVKERESFLKFKELCN